ncbi:MAG: hypothetical protein OFPI_40010 [Osedax symbiont Rs2]|nr:MAG: hypothetical protein OFPI_40010 [Osedax symbiont Rs2]
MKGVVGNSGKNMPITPSNSARTPTDRYNTCFIEENRSTSLFTFALCRQL